MAGIEVIRFLFWPQLSSRSLFPALAAPDPLVESPPPENHSEYLCTSVGILTSSLTVCHEGSTGIQTAKRFEPASCLSRSEKESI
jgi:hypothetical protein